MASTRKTLPPAGKLARHVLLPPLIAVVAVLCMLLAIAISFGHSAKATNPLAQKQGPSHDDVARQLSTDLEGTPTPADIARAQKPLSERRRLLAAHPYFSLYTIAKQRFGVSLYLIAAVHYQETGFAKAPAHYATYRRWTRHRSAIRNIVRPTRYPHRTTRHPSVDDDFDVVMAIAAGLKAARLHGLGPAATRTVAQRYGASPEGRLSAAMVLERARAWQLLGTLPLPGSGELATPVKGVVGGCGYFGCPRPGHLHNGVDFLAPTGVPIHAAEGGIVASVEAPGESGGYGNFVCIQHRPNLATCYAHMSAFAASVRPGVRVWRGQVIGLVGSTGSSTAPHLHFEVRRGAAACSACAIDPLPLLSGEVPATALPKMVSGAPAVVRDAGRAAAPVVAAPPAIVSPPRRPPVPPVPTRTPRTRMRRCPTRRSTRRRCAAARRPPHRSRVERGRPTPRPHGRHRCRSPPRRPHPRPPPSRRHPLPRRTPAPAAPSPISRRRRHPRP